MEKKLSICKHSFKSSILRKFKNYKHLQIRSSNCPQHPLKQSYIYYQTVPVDYFSALNVTEIHVFKTFFKKTEITEELKKH
jgi:hypothetical protein